jgi:hypothetical protein
MSACIRETRKHIFTLQIIFQMTTSTFKQSSAIDADIEVYLSAGDDPRGSFSSSNSIFLYLLSHRHLNYDSPEFDNP